MNLYEKIYRIFYNYYDPITFIQLNEYSTDINEYIEQVCSILIKNYIDKSNDDINIIIYLMTELKLDSPTKHPFYDWIHTSSEQIIENIKNVNSFTPILNEIKDYIISDYEGIKRVINNLHVRTCDNFNELIIRINTSYGILYKYDKLLKIKDSYPLHWSKYVAIRELIDDYLLQPINKTEIDNLLVLIEECLITDNSQEFCEKTLFLLESIFILWKYVLGEVFSNNNYTEIGFALVKLLMNEWTKCLNIFIQSLLPLTSTMNDTERNNFLELVSNFYNREVPPFSAITIKNSFKMFSGLKNI